MRPLALSLMCVLLGAAAGRAAAQAGDPVSAFYEARLEIDNLEGWHARRYLNQDHTFTQTGSDGAVRGTWALDGGKLCTTQTSPPPAPDRARTYCNLGPGHALVDKWADQDPVTGNPIFFSLVAGRP